MCTPGWSPSITRLTSALLAALAVLAVIHVDYSWAQDEEDLKTAISLANLLRAARTVISANQDLINDATIDDKGLSGQAVLGKAIENYRELTGDDPRDVDPGSRQGRLLAAQMGAVVEVMDENQATINSPNMGFKGFVPAVFARLVNERFKRKVGDEAEVKVTAPPELIRNRKARPDQWESEIIQNKLMSPQWPKGNVLWMAAQNNGREAFRLLVPEYYGAGCLACHGEPKGEIDITGYPKEGGKLGDLGGTISVTLFR